MNSMAVAKNFSLKKALPRSKSSNSIFSKWLYLTTLTKSAVNHSFLKLETSFWYRWKGDALFYSEMSTVKNRYFRVICRYVGTGHICK
jgi:hypothetical protein